MIFGLALSNFVVFWVEAHTMLGACVACPWYYPWSYTNEASCLLVAAALLRLGRLWSYVAACVLSEFLISQWAHALIVIGMTPLEDLRRLWLNPDLSILTEWEGQHILATIILGFAAFYLARDIYRRSAAKRAEF
jgi:hypothetical protein